MPPHQAQRRRTIWDKVGPHEWPPFQQLGWVEEPVALQNQQQNDPPTPGLNVPQDQLATGGQVQQEMAPIQQQEQQQNQQEEIPPGHAPENGPNNDQDETEERIRSEIIQNLAQYRQQISNHMLQREQFSNEYVQKCQEQRRESKEEFKRSCYETKSRLEERRQQLLRDHRQLEKGYDNPLVDYVRHRTMMLRDTDLETPLGQIAQNESSGQDGQETPQKEWQHLLQFGQHVLLELEEDWKLTLREMRVDLELAEVITLASWQDMEQELEMDWCNKQEEVALLWRQMLHAQETSRQNELQNTQELEEFIQREKWYVQQTIIEERFGLWRSIYGRMTEHLHKIAQLQEQEMQKYVKRLDLHRDRTEQELQLLEYMVEPALSSAAEESNELDEATKLWSQVRHRMSQFDSYVKDEIEKAKKQCNEDGKKFMQNVHLQLLSLLYRMQTATVPLV